MAELSINLNKSPYWVDYSPNSQYYMVLQTPGPPIQSREMNDVQAMVSHQISSFGDNIFVGGSIVTGCNMNFDCYISYVKLLDNYANGSALTASDLIGFTAVSNSGLIAYIKNANQGYQATPPNLNTLFVKYLNSATDPTIKVFQNDEVLTVFNTANVGIASIVVANTASSGSSNTTGMSYAVSVDDGIVYQKGLFLDVLKQSLIITPYTNIPDNISVGFASIESTVTAFQDPSLNDIAQGAVNFQAPGADRLKIVPSLVAVSTNTINPNNFFSIVDFVGGSPSIINQDSQYAAIGQKMASISDDTNGSFVINPFNVRALQLQTTNTAYNVNNIKLEIDSGLAYVNGAKVQIVGKQLSILQKGTDVGVANSQIITTQYGSYVTVQDVGGMFDPSNLQSVSLRTANCAAVTHYLANGVAINSIAPPGSEIGKANIIGSKYISGDQNLGTSQYNFYLFNVIMNAGQAFTSVASLFANNSNVLGFADIVQANSTTYSNLQQPNTALLIYSLNQNAVDTLKNSSNNVDTAFNFVQSSSVSFLTSGVSTITIPTSLGGTNILPYGTGTLSPTLLPNFNVVAEANAHSANITGSVATTSACNIVTGTSTAFESAVTVGEMITIANGSTVETKVIRSIANDGSLTTTTVFNNSWAGGNVCHSFLNGSVIPLEAIGGSVDIISPTSFSISLGTTINTSLAANVSYFIQRTASTPRKKDLKTDVWVKIDCSTNPGGNTGPWCLGIPDILNVKNVYVGTTYSNTNPTSNLWTLNNGQTDLFYGPGYLNNHGMSLTASDKLLVQLESFVSDPSTGLGFFSIDSYPVDDTGVSANSIYTQDIPTYYSINAQKLFDLRNSIDFRIETANTIPYCIGSAAIANTLIINPANSVTFTTADASLPVPDTEFETSVQYYKGRYDTIGLSATGLIVVNRGISSENPIPPSNIINGITLGTMFIPPYPSITPDIIDNNMRNSYPTTYFNYSYNRRYTMADIGTLDKRLQQVEYYTSLSLLEQSAQNLLLSNPQGQTRFQNGMLADPMSDFSIANTTDPSFNIAIDSDQSVARPIFEQNLCNLQLNSSNSTNVVMSNNDRLITLTYTQAGPLISQPFASQVRNCSQDILYTWTGTLTLNPDGDYFPDVTTNPTVAVNLDLYSNWINLTNAWNTQWGTWNESSSTSVTTSSTAVTSTTTTTATQTILNASPENNSYSFGNVVTSVSLQPFCRANLIKFSAYGLKPNTQFWTFLDDVSISSYCIQANSSWVPLTTGTMISDSNGNINGYFYMPAGTFNSGALNFQLVDVSNLVTESNIITSLATAIYYGTNLAYTQNNLSLNTVQPQFSSSTVSSTSQSTTVVAIPQPTPTIQYVYQNQSVGNVNYQGTQTSTGHGPGAGTGGGGSASGAAGAGAGGGTGGTSGGSGGGPGGSGAGSGTGAGGTGGSGDPLGQIFTIVPSAFPGGVEAIYITSIDIFFQHKDPSLGVTLDIRTMENGNPTTSILPFSSTHLNSSQINISADSSVKTNILFGAPVLMLVGQSYTFVLTPDGSNPNYDVWTAVISGKDVITNAPIYALSATGPMVLSSQGSVWTPYQNEAVKFNLYIASFNQFSGVAVFNNDDSEYFNVANNFGSMNIGDQLFFANMANNIGGNTTSGSNTINITSNVGISTSSAIGITSIATGKSLVSGVASVGSTSLVLKTAVPFTDSAAAIYNLTLSGFVGSSNTTFLKVANSSANVSVYFSNSYNYAVIDASRSAFTTTTALLDLPYDTLMPKFSTSIPALCGITINTTGTANAFNSYLSDSQSNPLTFGLSTDFYDQERVVMSKSNEMHYKSGTKSLKLTGSMSSVISLESPAFDMIKAGAVVIQNIVNAESGLTVFNSEVQNNGLAINRYISTTTALVSNLAAEDLQVYIGAFYPANTDIYVYGKILNQYDPDPFVNKLWTPMYTTNTQRSSKINPQDINEYIYTFGNAPIATYDAYDNLSNNDIVNYTNPAGQTFTTFNVFAIKIVLLADASMNVPMVSDLRAMALS